MLFRSIGFESRKDVGSTFWAWVPCDKINKQTDLDVKVARAIDKLEQSKLNILIAEDNDSNFILLKSILKNHNIIRAINGQEAIDKCSNDNYDIVLMDIILLVVDGLEATRKIREFDLNIPIIALTANAFDSDREKTIMAGCNEFIAKPVRKQVLFDTIYKFI